MVERERWEKSGRIAEKAIGVKRGQRREDEGERRSDDGEGNKVAVCRSRCQISASSQPLTLLDLFFDVPFHLSVPVTFLPAASYFFRRCLE